LLDDTVSEPIVVVEFCSLLKHTAGYEPHQGGSRMNAPIQFRQETGSRRHDRDDDHIVRPSSIVERGDTAISLTA